MLDLINPWMLAALAGAAIPLVIEWLFRRRRRIVDLPTIRFLLSARHRHRVRLQDLILLLLRTALLVILAAALTRPVWRPAEGGTLGGTRHAVIVLDATYSMAQTVGQTTAFELARARADEVLAALPEQMDVALLCLADRAQAQCDWTTPAAARDALARLVVSDGAGRMTDAIEATRALVDGLAGQPAEVYVVSDLQRATWSPTPDDPRDAGAFLDDLAARARVFVLDTGGGDRANAAVTRFEPTQPALAAGRPADFQVDVEASNLPPDAALRLTLFAQRTDAPSREGPSSRPTTQGASPFGRKVDTLTLGAADFTAGRLTATFRHTFLEPGEHLLTVELDGDGLPADNRRRYLASVPAAIETLIVESEERDQVPSDGRPGLLSPDFPASAGAWLRSAIAPAVPPGFEPVTPFAATVVEPADVFLLNLDDYAVVVLAGVPDPNDALVSRLERYVADGGHLLFFVGEGVDPYTYNRRLLKEGTGLLPCELIEAVGGDGQLRNAEFGMGNATSRPAVSTSGKSGDSLERLSPGSDRGPGMLSPDFPATRPAAFVGITYTQGSLPAHPAVVGMRHLLHQAPVPTIAQSMRLRLAAGGRRYGTAVAWFTNGEPAICEKAFGLGRVCLVATSADPVPTGWHLMAFTNEYPVLVQELARWLAGRPDEGVNLRQGDPYTQPVLLSGQHLLLRRPDHERVRLTPASDPDGEVWRVTYAQTDRQGLYVVDAPPEVLRRRRFVVNLRAAESDLTRLDVTALARAMGPRAALWPADAPIRRAVQARHSIREFAAPIIWGLFVLLAVETFLAARFGRRRG